jgi:nucleoside-diphosphate-sugar epimerase
MASKTHTVLVGSDSNLTRALVRAWPDATVVSARAIADGAEPWSGGPVDVVLNAFQPADRLGDLGAPRRYVELALGVTARVLEGVAAGRVRRVLYTSSASVYGDNVECRESDRIRASGLHASLKAANEALVLGVCAERGVEATVARVFNLFGGADRFSIIRKIVDAARTGSTLVLANGGNAIRDFVHVDDVVRAYVALMDGPHVPVVNIASGVGVSVRSILDALELRGVRVATTNVVRDEIRVSTANVELLSRYVDPATFDRPAAFVLREVGV